MLSETSIMKLYDIFAEKIMSEKILSNGLCYLIICYQIINMSSDIFILSETVLSDNMLSELLCYLIMLCFLRKYCSIHFSFLLNIRHSLLLQIRRLNDKAYANQEPYIANIGLVP
jgi:hypothetical protein